MCDLLLLTCADMTVSDMKRQMMSTTEKDKTMADSPELELTIRFANFDDLRSWMDNTDGRSTAPAPAPTPAPVAAPAAAPVDPNVSAAAPAAPASPTANHGEVERDAQGMPYDPGIHTTTKTLNADGTWKALRGMAEQAKAARAEFLARGGAAATTPTPAPAPAADVTPAATPAATGMPGMTAPAAAPAAMPGSAPAAREVSMEELVTKTASMMESGALNTDILRGYYQQIGVTSPDQFASDASKRLSMMQILESI